MSTWRGFRRLFRSLTAVSVLTAPLSACATAPLQVVSIKDVIDNHEAMDGKRVHLKGWIAGCGNYTCEMYELPGAGGAAIRLGYSPAFDSQFVRFGGSEVKVEVEGIVHADCFDHDRDDPKPSELIVCTDRAEQIAKPRLIKVISVPSKEK